MFYRKKLKWYHRLWNIFAYAIEFVFLAIYELIGLVPAYILAGEDKALNIADMIMVTLIFTDKPV